MSQIQTCECARCAKKASLNKSHTMSIVAELCKLIDLSNEHTNAYDYKYPIKLFTTLSYHFDFISSDKWAGDKARNHYLFTIIKTKCQELKIIKSEKLQNILTIVLDKIAKYEATHL
jgi:hypothetical protein